MRGAEEGQKKGIRRLLEGQKKGKRAEEGQKKGRRWAEEGD